MSTEFLEFYINKLQIDLEDNTIYSDTLTHPVRRSMHKFLFKFDML